MKEMLEAKNIGKWHVAGSIVIGVLGATAVFLWLGSFFGWILKEIDKINFVN